MTQVTKPLLNTRLYHFLSLRDFVIETVCSSGLLSMLNTYHEIASRLMSHFSQLSQNSDDAI